MRFSWIAFLAATSMATCAPAMAQDRSSIQTMLPAKTGVWTYAGTGTVNTYWIETPGGGLVVIDVQRDLVHAAQALAAVKAVGKPVRAILITHAHPDHYTGLGLFRQAFPGVPVYASKATADAIRYDTYGANAGTQADAPDITPRDFVVPGITFDGDTTLQIDGLTIIARELGAGEAPVAHVGTHGIRHRAATDIANSGIPLKVGMALTAHKTVTMFMRYVHVEDEQVRNAAEVVAQRRAAIIQSRGKPPPRWSPVPFEQLPAGGSVPKPVAGSFPSDLRRAANDR